jgi:hypothetical protein
VIIFQVLDSGLRRNDEAFTKVACGTVYSEREIHWPVKILQEGERYE